MNGETKLSILLKNMQPQLQPGEYVFCTVPSNEVIKQIAPICIFQEVEGTTFIISKQQADEFSIPAVHNREMTSIHTSIMQCPNI